MVAYTMKPLALLQHVEDTCRYYSFSGSIVVPRTKIPASTQLLEATLNYFNGHGLKGVLGIKI